MTDPENDTPRLDRPLLLRPDNFTPPTRTPWGGTRIVAHYKAELPIDPARRHDRVGESWEVSATPEFGSTLEDGGGSLAAALAADPARALGREAGHGRSSTALLVKLLDAAEPLSVQIHPSDDYGALGPDEAGKPESWYVLEATDGAGLYLGLAEGVSREQLAEAIETGDDVSALLGFVPVEPGDFFIIDAGTAHAIGAGLTLVEPQHVAPGRRGVTYRYWDWNRRYDADGQPDPRGEARALHVEDALAVTAWDAPRGEALLSQIRVRAGEPAVAEKARIEHLAGPVDAPIASTHLVVDRLSGTGDIEIPTNDTLTSLTVVAGRLTLEGPEFTIVVERGRSAVLPAALGTVKARCEGVHGLLCAIA